MTSASTAKSPTRTADRSGDRTISTSPVWPLALGLFALAVAFRITQTDAMVNVDMFNSWSRRITLFMQGLASGDLASTYQSHHPGVTFMWLAGLIWKAAGVLGTPLDPHKLSLAVLPVALVGSVFAASSYLLTLRALGRERHLAAFLTGACFATEPMFVAHSRNAHLDMLVSSLAWSAVLTATIAKRELSTKWAIGSGALLGMALLTKLSSAGFALGIAAMFLLLPKRLDALEFAPRLRILTTITIAAAVVVVALWPALWVAPIASLNQLRLGLHHEVDKVSEFMLFGETGRLDLPPWIYAVFLVFLVTPEFWMPAVIAIATLRTSEPKLRRFSLDIIVATLPLVVLLSQSARVGNRFLVSMLPLFGTLSAIGIAQVMTRLKAFSLPLRMGPYAGVALLVGLISARCCRLVALHPLPITYCSSWTGVDCIDAFHIGWGEGLKEAARIVAAQTELRGWMHPPRIFGSTYAPTIGVWTPVAAVKSLDAAQILVEYLPDRQRRIKPAMAIADYVTQQGVKPLGEVVVNHRLYVRLYPGPAYF